jgi:hypothetical protein
VSAGAETARSAVKSLNTSRFARTRTALKDEIATAQNQLKLLDSLASNPAGSANKAVVDAANLAAVLGTMATGENAARKRVRDANLQLRTVDRQLEKLKADLAKVATTSRQSTEVRASILAGAAGTAGVAVSYKVGNAGWDWIYQARLDTAKKRLVLDRQGSVAQGTGEDWNDAELTLTTRPAGPTVSDRRESVRRDSGGSRDPKYRPCGALGGGLHLCGHASDRGGASGVVPGWSPCWRGGDPGISTYGSTSPTTIRWRLRSSYSTEFRSARMPTSTWRFSKARPNPP